MAFGGWCWLTAIDGFLTGIDGKLGLDRGVKRPAGGEKIKSRGPSLFLGSCIKKIGYDLLRLFTYVLKFYSSFIFLPGCNLGNDVSGQLRGAFQGVVAVLYCQ
jgi:hypothetical protein